MRILFNNFVSLLYLSLYLPVIFYKYQIWSGMAAIVTVSDWCVIITHFVYIVLASKNNQVL